MKNTIEIYTDGACVKNPGGAGGYAAIIIEEGTYTYDVQGGSPSTTNNRMELMAVIEGLKSLKTTSGKVKIYSDSKYVVDSINKGWLQNWIQRKTIDSRPNCDLWKELNLLLSKHHPSFTWVKGHSNNKMNQLADGMAGEQAKQYAKKYPDAIKDYSKQQKIKSGKSDKVNFNDPEFQRFMWNFYKKYKNKLNF